MTGLYRVFDAAVPPAVTPPGCLGVLGYLGREGYAYRVWTPADWKQHTGPGIVQFPCWVPNLRGNPQQEADTLLSYMHDAGFTPSTGHILAAVIDYETTGISAAGWHSALTQELGRYSVDGIAYGSLSTVVQIEAAHLWVASWDGNATFDPAGQTVHAHQYAGNVAYAGTTVDYSVADNWLMSRGLPRK
jgi:hypothetical protein